MHKVKVSLWAMLMLGLALVLVSCAGAERTSIRHDELAAQKVALLDSAYRKLLVLSQSSAPADSIYPMLTDGSKDWLDDVEQAALQAPREDLEKRPFHEIMTIITYRLLLREHKFAGIPEDRMLRLATGSDGFLQKINKLKLGDFEVRNDRGSRGLANSPKVPVLVFAWDDRNWKLDLVESLPLVTRGLETIGVKKNWTPAATVLFLLERDYHNVYRNVDESLLDPVPSI